MLLIALVCRYVVKTSTFYFCVFLLIDSPAVMLVEINIMQSGEELTELKPKLCTSIQDNNTLANNHMKNY